MTRRDRPIFRQRWEILFGGVVWHTIVTRGHSILELDFELLEGKRAAKDVEPKSLSSF